MTSFLICRAIQYITDCHIDDGEKAASTFSFLSSSTKFTAAAPHVTDFLAFKPDEFACLREISNNSIRWTKQIYVHDFDFSGKGNADQSSASFFFDGNYFLNLQDILLYDCNLPSTSQFILPHLINHPTIDAVTIISCRGTRPCAFYVDVVGTNGIRARLKEFCLLELADNCGSGIPGAHSHKTVAYNSGAIDNICQLLTDESKNENLLVPALKALSAIADGNPLVTIEDKKRILPGLDACLFYADAKVWGAALKNIRVLFGPRSDRDEVLNEVDGNYSHWWARFEYLALNMKDEETETVWKVIAVLVNDEDSLPNNILQSLYGFFESTLQKIADDPASFFFDNTKTNDNNTTTRTDVAGQVFHLLPRLCKKNKQYFRNHPRILKLAMKILLWTTGNCTTEKFCGNPLIVNFWPLIKMLCRRNGGSSAYCIQHKHAKYLPVIAHLNADAQNEMDCYSLSTEEERGLLLLDNFATSELLSPLFELFNQPNSNNDTITATNNNDQPTLHLLTDETAVRTEMSKIKKEAERQKAQHNDNNGFLRSLSKCTINTRVLNLFMHGQGVAEFLVENNVIELCMAVISLFNGVANEKKASLWVMLLGDIVDAECVGDKLKDQVGTQHQVQHIFVGTHQVDGRTGQIVARPTSQRRPSTLVRILGSTSGNVMFSFGRLELLKRICRLYAVEEKNALMKVLRYSRHVSELSDPGFFGRSDLISHYSKMIQNLVEQLEEIYRLAKTAAE